MLAQIGDETEKPLIAAFSMQRRPPEKWCCGILFAGLNPTDAAVMEQKTSLSCAESG
jgi:hypothetical protein